MKKSNYFFLRGLVGPILLACVLISCDEQEIDDLLVNDPLSATSETEDLSPSIYSGYIDQVSIYLQAGSNVNGDVIVELRNEDGIIMATSKISESDLSPGNFSWYSVVFNKPIYATPGKYRIYVRRTGSHDYGSGDYVFWGSTNYDAYPNGTAGSSSGGTLSGDFAFRAYVDGSVKEKQEIRNYGYALNSSSFWYQEFNIPNKYIRFLELNLNAGSNVEGEVVIEIRNSDGSIVLGTSSISGSNLSSGSKWYIVDFNNQVPITDTLCSIYVKRTGTHDYQAGNYVAWRSSSLLSGDVYPQGVSGTSTGSITPVDFSFKVHVDAFGLIEEEQTLINYGFMMSSNYYRYQQFMLD